mgnify:CR=1 FL=1
MKKILVLFLPLMMMGCAPEPEQPDYHWSAVELLREQRGGLTDWQKLQMAIIWTESKGNPNVTGSHQDGGLYQMTPIFVEEVNRIAGTSYTHEDVYDPDKAIEIFNTMHLFKNPDRNLEQAIRIHNKSAGYLNTVMRNYELIERMEIVRQKLIEYEHD